MKHANLSAIYTYSGRAAAAPLWKQNILFLKPPSFTETSFIWLTKKDSAMLRSCLNVRWSRSSLVENTKIPKREIQGALLWKDVWKLLLPSSSGYAALFNVHDLYVYICFNIFTIKHRLCFGCHTTSKVEFVLYFNAQSNMSPFSERSGWWSVTWLWLCALSAEDLVG